MARKPGKKGPDYFTTVFGVLFAGEQEIDFAQFLFDHPGLTGLLIEAARNGDEITLEMLKEADLGEFRVGGESSDLASQFQLAVFLQKAAEQYEFNPLPWMGQQEEPSAKKKPRRKPAKKKTTSSGESATEQAVKKLGGTKASATKALKEAGSLKALAEKLRKAGVSITNSNLSFVFRRKWKINARQLLAGTKSVGKRKVTRKEAGKKSDSVKLLTGITSRADLVERCDGSEKKALKVIERAQKELGSMRNLAEATGVALSSLWQHKKKLAESVSGSSGKSVRKKKIRKATKKSKGTGTSVAAKVEKTLGGAEGALEKLKEHSIPQLFKQLREKIPGLTLVNLRYVLSKKLKVTVAQARGMQETE